MKIWYLFPAFLALAGCPKNSGVDTPDPDPADTTGHNRPNPQDSTVVDATHPNIIYVICDQMFVNKIHAMGVSGTMGGSNNRTPNLDYLVQNGYYFTHAYCAFPLSVPSRFSIFTGRNAAEFGINGNDNNSDAQIAAINSIPQGDRLGYLFQNAGYTTVYGGKTHLPGPATALAQVNTYGFTVSFSTNVHAPLGTSAAAQIGKCAKAGKPFFLVASFINPHDIDFFDDAIGYPVTGEDSENNGADIFNGYFATSQAYVNAGNWGVFPDVMPNAGRPVPSPVGDLGYHGNNGKNMPGVHPGFLIPDATHNPPLPLPADARDKLFRQRAWIYDRLCETLDSDIAPIIDTIRKLNLLGNSILIFTADHGELNGAHELERKQAPFEECQRVPFIILGKGIKQKKDDNIIQTGADLTPTLCDLAGIQWPAKCTGLSLKGLLTGTSTALERDYIFTDGPKWNQVVYQGRWKYTVIKPWANWWYEFLVDLQNDPGEMKNLYNDPASQTMKEQLKSILYPDMARRGLEVPGSGTAKIWP